MGTRKTIGDHDAAFAEPEATKLLHDSPLALLLGMLLEQ
jgi:hypothetical protein